MKNFSIGDVVFLEIATTVCFLAVTGRMGAEQFLNVVGVVFAAYYVHKAQNKPQPEPANETIISSEK